MNILACGALANELMALKHLNAWDDLNIRCLPAHYHQTPHKIPDAVKKAIDDIRQHSDADILVAYGDCGTGGRLDAVLAEADGAQRLPGAHCYEFFAGSKNFAAMQDAEVGTFYLTDFLVAHFDTYVWKMLGLDRKPELLDMYFGNYTKLMYLAQTQTESLTRMARAHAQTLGLEFETCFTAYGELGEAFSQRIQLEVAAPCLI